MPNSKGTRRTFGRIRQLQNKSKRFQASYVGPDGQRYVAPTTFQTYRDADAWLAKQQAAITDAKWKTPAAMSQSLRAYAQEWVANRTTKDGEPLKPKTVSLYRGLLDSFILTAAFVDLPMPLITGTSVQQWFNAMGKQTGRVRRWQAYALLRAIFNQARKNRLIHDNPCSEVYGCSRPSRDIEIKVPSVEQLEDLALQMPGRHQMIVVMAAWSSLRLGELCELRRSDVFIDLDAGVGWVRVDRSVSLIGKNFVVGTPKSKAGKRTVMLPPHILAPLAEHIEQWCAPGKDGLIFPSPKNRSQHLNPSTLEHHWYRARKAVGMQDFRFHDLRHTGNTYAAMTGATLKELMARAGHTSPEMALAYQHVAEGRDQIVASGISELVKRAKEKSS